MKFFLDTADLKEIEKAASTGLLDGITTNPSLVAKTGMKFEQLLVKICEMVDGPISAEVISTNSAGMIEEGRKLAAIHKNIVVKVPLTPEGLKACKTLTFEGKRVNVTLCFTPLQALMAAKAGATYISPFVGRLDDIGHAGMELISEIRLIYKNYGFKTEILVASVRHLEHLLQAARMGADVATIPYKVFEQTFVHPLTDSGLARFLKDWETAQKG